MAANNGTGGSNQSVSAALGALNELEAAGLVQRWLESAWEWFVEHDDLASARTVLAVVETLAQNRETLMEQMQSVAEQESARAMIGG